jgi:hypothetical protein
LVFHMIILKFCEHCKLFIEPLINLRFQDDWNGYRRTESRCFHSTTRFLALERGKDVWKTLEFSSYFWIASCIRTAWTNFF